MESIRDEKSKAVEDSKS